MNRLLSIVMLAAMLVACNSGGYKIKGTFEAAEDGCKVYLLKPNEMLEIVDSAVVRNGRFEFSGGYHDRTVRMLLVPSKATGGPVVLEPGEVTVHFGREMERGGTDGNEILQRFISGKRHFDGLVSVTSPTFVTAMGMGESMLDSLAAEKEKAKAMLATYSALAIENNIENSLGVYILSQSYEVLDAFTLATMLDCVPLYFRDSRYDVVKNYATHIMTVAMAQNKMAVGAAYQDFELTEMNGEKVIFSDVVKKNDFTLLYFWASWCAPCRAELPQIEDACKKYKEKGLAVVSVSLDSNIDEFKSAVGKLALSGVKLCNPAGGSSEVATAYGVDAIPANVLIGKDGMIVARNASPGELEVLLAKILE